MKDIDWSRIKFFARKDTWFVDYSECVCKFDYGNSQHLLDDVVDNNSGMFFGKTNETFKGYDGELPREDEEGCAFDEFDIYFEGELINKITYRELLNRMKSSDRDSKIKNVLNV